MAHRGSAAGLEPHQWTHRRLCSSSCSRARPFPLPGVLFVAVGLQPAPATLILTPSLLLCQGHPSLSRSTLPTWLFTSWELRSLHATAAVLASCTAVSSQSELKYSGNHTHTFLYKQLSLFKRQSCRGRGRKEGRGRERERAFCHSLAHFPRLQWPGWGHMEATSSEYHPGLQCGCRDSGAWAILHCFPIHVRPEVKQPGIKPAHIRSVSLIGCSLIFYSTAPTNATLLKE